MTTFDQHANLAVATVSPGSTVVGSATGDNLVADSGAVAAIFPSVPFDITVWRDELALRPAAEIMRVVAFDGDRTFTVLRAQQGTIALPGIALGWHFANTITVGDVEAIEDAVTTEESARAAGDIATLAAAESYADVKVAAEATARSVGDATTLTDAETYTDGRVASEAASRVAGDAATLGSAETYTDSQVSAEAAARSAADTATLSAAESYAVTEVASEATARVAGDAATLTSAEDYADSGDASTLASAKTYSDGRLSAKTYVSLADVDATGLADGELFAWRQALTKFTPIDARSMTAIVVAASDSRRDGLADIKADGSNDQEALAAALALVTGPTVIQLLDGNWDIGGAWAVGEVNHPVVLQGLGAGVTVLGGNPGAGVSPVDLSQTAGKTLSRFTIRDLTIDASGYTSAGGSDVTRGLIRDVGAGTLSRITIEDVEFLAGTQWSLSPFVASNDSGFVEWMVFRRLRVVSSGIAMYGVAIRKPGAHGWILDCDVEFNDNGHGFDAYNAYAIYGGFDDFHVVGNSARVHQGHSPISCSPAHNGEIVGNNVQVTVPGAGESGIEVQFKIGHGADADTSHDVVVVGNVVKGAYDGIVVNNNDDVTNPSQRPYNVLVGPNSISGSTRYDVYLQHGISNVRATGGNGKVQQDGTCVGTVSPGSDLGGPISVNGGGVSEVQQIVVANATGGTFTLTYAGLTTAALAFNATAAQVQTALRALSAIGTGVVCSGGPLGTSPVTITFQNSLGSRDVAQITATDNTTGSGHSVTVTTVTPGTPAFSPVGKIVLSAPHIFLANGGTLLLGNAAGTSVQRGIFRDENNVIRVGHGGGRDMLVGDTSGRMGIGDAFINPSSVDSSANYPAIVVKVPLTATRFIIAAGPNQATAGTASTPVNLLDLLDNASAKLAGFTNTGALDLKEQTDPAAPAADTVRVYSRDNGAGKTQLIAVFNTGAVQVLATQP